MDDQEEMAEEEEFFDEKEQLNDVQNDEYQNLIMKKHSENKISTHEKNVLLERYEKHCKAWQGQPSQVQQNHDASDISGKTHQKPITSTTLSTISANTKIVREIKESQKIRLAK